MTWVVDDRHEKIYGSVRMAPERQGGETAHRISLPDGRVIRVLPDGTTSGQARARVSREACKETADLKGGSVDLIANHLIGRLAMAGVLWDWVDEAREAREALSITDWLVVWCDARDMSEAWAHQLLNDLKTDGWQIVRAG